MLTGQVQGTDAAAVHVRAGVCAGACACVLQPALDGNAFTGQSSPWQSMAIHGNPFPQPRRPVGSLIGIMMPFGSSG